MARTYEIDPRELTEDHKNANKGTKRGRDLHEKSFERLGAGRSILLDKDNRIIAGNKTAEVAVSKGVPIRVIETHGDELIAVKRVDMDLTDDHGTAREMAYADNLVGYHNLALAEDIIKADVESGVEATSEYFFPEELAKLGAWSDDEDDAEDEEPDVEDNPLPEPPPTYEFETGDTVLMGAHRLLVGDIGHDEVKYLINQWKGFSGYSARVIPAWKKRDDEYGLHAGDGESGQG